MPTLTTQGGFVDFVLIGEASKLRAASARHHITLRHRQDPKQYHSLLLFSFPRTSREAAAKSVNVDSEDIKTPGADRFYCMEAACPHLGAPLENASIYDVDEEDDIEDAVIVCPWHEYDFSLSTGESSTGLKACTYEVCERDGQIWVAAPLCEGQASLDALWDVIEVRPVREDYAGRETAMDNVQKALEAVKLDTTASEDAPIADPDPLPKTLVEWAVAVLNTPEPRRKVEYTRRAAHAFRSGQCRGVGGGFASRADNDEGAWTSRESETPPQIPPRLADAKVVRPGQEGRRGKGGSGKSRIAMLHSLANIEQWAIDLAWDIIARAPRLYAQIAPPGKKLPMQFFSDFVKVAEDEAKHFSLLQQRLHDMGAAFGDLPVHHGLWDSAQETMHNLAARLCIIHLVHEARGLDANPLTIKKFDNAGDKESVEVLTTIHLDEVTHVSAGHRWLTYICGTMEPAQAPVDVFRDNVRRHFAGKLKGPFNAEDRSRAGLSRDYYENLVGEKPSMRPGHQSGDETKGGAPFHGVARAEIPGG